MPRSLSESRLETNVACCSFLGKVSSSPMFAGSSCTCGWDPGQCQAMFPVRASAEADSARAEGWGALGQRGALTFGSHDFAHVNIGWRIPGPAAAQDPRQRTAQPEAASLGHPPRPTGHPQPLAAQTPEPSSALAPTQPIPASQVWSLSVSVAWRCLPVLVSMTYKSRCAPNKDRFPIPAHPTSKHQT